MAQRRGYVELEPGEDHRGLWDDPRLKSLAGGHSAPPPTGQHLQQEKALPFKNSSPYLQRGHPRRSIPIPEERLARSTRRTKDESGETRLHP